MTELQTLESLLGPYRRSLRAHARERTGEVITNASVEHASAVVETLFAEAKSEVDILTGALTPRVYGRDAVVEEAKLFLASSYRNRLRIILETDSPRDRMNHPLLKECSAFENLCLRRASPATQKLYGFHFLVADADCYRFERDKSRPNAIASFGHEEGAQNLKRIFEALWNRCDPIEIHLQTIGPGGSVGRGSQEFDPSADLPVSVPETCSDRPMQVRT